MPRPTGSIAAPLSVELGAIKMCRNWLEVVESSGDEDWVPSKARNCQEISGLHTTQAFRQSDSLTYLRASRRRCAICIFEIASPPRNWLWSQGVSHCIEQVSYIPIFEY